jgi:peptidoglycan/LPS O-acetylase OafA/YrhL
VTLLVGSIILSPSETREFAGSALASLDRRPTSFFTTAPTTLPMPPTTDRSCTPGRSAWKSSFYLLFPLILGVLVVRAGAAPARILAYLVALSLAWCEVVGLFRARHAFYMPTARCWELGAGALIACA